MKLFTEIRQIIENPKSLVCVIIDEVESIAYARDSLSCKYKILINSCNILLTLYFFVAAEPSDSLRVVNAVLTQLDKIRHYPNVLVLTTSNLTSTIDIAFVDRADIKQYIGNPPASAIYTIFLSAIQQLIEVS